MTVSRKALGLWSAGAVLALVAGSAGMSAPGPQKVGDFQLPDQNYIGRHLYKMADAKAVVLITYQAGDAAFRADAPAYKALRDAYAARGVEFLILDPKLGESRQTVAADKAASDLGMPILFDYEQLTGEDLDVSRAAEVIVINPKDWTIAFRGPVSHASTRRALDSLVDGKSIALPAVAARGGAIAFPLKAAVSKTGNLSYAKDVAPIIQAKCVACHQPGGIGPMTLTSYEQIRGHGQMIREVLRNHRMPPFQPDPTVGHWAPDDGLSSDQLKTVVHWIEAGAPRGAGDDPLAKITFRAPEWPMGQPDLILTLPEVKVPATGVMPYQNQVLDTRMTEGRWERATAFNYEDRQALHHIVTGIRVPSDSGRGVTLDGNSDSLGGQGPGRVINLTPPEMGVWVPAGSQITFQNHFTPYGRETTENIKLGIYFYPKGQEPKYPLRTYGLQDYGISIPAGAEYHPETSYLDVPKDMLLYGLTPHAHMRGGSTQVSIKFPDGHEQLILAVPKYQFDWQTEYYLKEPILAPAGSKIINRWTYDNSTRNTNNPDPAKVVAFGEQSWEEMLSFFIHYRWVGETTAAPREDYDRLLMAGQTMGVLDDNMNGKIEVAEMRGRNGVTLKNNLANYDLNRDNAIDLAELAKTPFGRGNNGGATPGAGVSGGARPVAATTPARAAAN